MLKTSGAAIYKALSLVQELEKDCLMIKEGSKINMSYQELFSIKIMGMNKEEMEDMDENICMLGIVLMTLSKMLQKKINE